MRRRWLGVVLLLIAAEGAAGQTSVEPKTDSPFKIARVVNRSLREWQRKRVSLDVDLSATWERLGLDAGEFGGCSGGGCEARTSLHELNGRPGREVILELARPYHVCRFVVFGRAPRRAGWRVLGMVEHDFNRYENATHRIVRAASRNWLVVRGQEGSGSGYWLTGETWYEAGAGGLRPVLHYPVQAHVAPWPEGVGREFTARVVPAPRAAKAVTLAYTVSYAKLDYIKDEHKQLYRNRHRVTYVWDARRRAFVFNAARSTISEAEVAALADLAVEPGEGQQIGGTEFFSEGDAWKRGGYDVFLKYNLRSLLRLARRGRARDREWLGRVLVECADTRQRRLLEAALRKRP